MHNIWLIFKNDFRHLFSNVVSVVIMVGLVVLPSLFAWYNILACWDVFDNTGNLQVAVANSDEGYESDLVPLRVNVGERVISGLRENDQIDWIFTTEDEAVEGVKAGRYYAAVVISETFSRDMLTFYTDDMQHAKILYYVNEKKNAIAPRITGIGADAVSYQINQVFADTVSEISLAMLQSLSNYVDTGDIDGRVAELSQHMRRVADRLDQTAEVLGLYASLDTESQNMVSSSAAMLTSQEEAIDSAIATVNSNGDTLVGLAATLRTAATNLSSSLESNQQTLANLEGNLDSLLSSASQSLQSGAETLRSGAAGFDKPISDCESGIATLRSLRDVLPQEQAAIVEAAITLKTNQLSLLTDVQNKLLSAAQALEAGDADAQNRIAALKQHVTNARGIIDATKADYDANLKPSLQQLAADVETLANDLRNAVAGLGSLGGNLEESMNATAGALGTASAKVTQSSAELRTAANSIRQIADTIDIALSSNDIDTLRKLLEGDAANLASMLSAPVQIERQAVFPADNFGSSMAPLYSALALFVGALLIMVATKPQVSKRGRQKLTDPKPRELYFGRFGVVAFMSLLQSTLMGLGNLLFLQVQAVHPLLFMLCYWFSGLVFAFVIYTLVVSFENLGKGIAVLMLIIQVTACGGSYPLQILPNFVQWLSPYLPATHVVNAMRAAMMGIYQNDFWISMGLLALFIIPALLLGLVLRKPMERFMRFYISKVEDSKLM